MNKKCFTLLLVAAMLGSCTTSPESNTSNAEITKGDSCSVNISGIDFTKSLNSAIDSSEISGETLIIRSGSQSDNFNDPDGKLSNNTAPVLLTSIDNTQPFTFTAKVTPTFIDTYDAGTLYIYQNPKWWFKFAFELDERKKTRMVTVRTTETSDDNNHDVVDSSSVYMKISSDTKTVGFYYSNDKRSWQLVRLFRNDYPAAIWVGLSTQSPIGNGTSVKFEDCTLTQISISDFRMGE